MKRFNGGDEVRGGYFWHMGNWEVATVAGETGKLPGGPTEQYLRAPLPALLVAAPVMGLTFAIFLPFIGFATTAWALGKKVLRHAPARTAKAH